MSLQEEFMHVNTNKFAINDGAGHCIIDLLWTSFDEEAKKMNLIKSGKTQ